MAAEHATGQLSWLLDSLIGRLEHVQQALVLSRDGLVVAASQNMSREDSDHLSALAAGSRAWPAGPDGSSAEERYGRPSSRWSTRSCSSPPPGRERASRC